MAHLDGPPIKHFRIDPGKGSLGLPPFFFSYLQLRHRAEPRSIPAAPGGREPGAAVPPSWSSCPTVPAQQRAAAGCRTDVPDRALQQRHPGATVPKSTSPAMAMMLLSDAQVPGCKAGGPEDPHLRRKRRSPPLFLFHAAASLKSGTMGRFLKTYRQVQYIVTEIVLKQVEDGEKNEWL